MAAFQRFPWPGLDPFPPMRHTVDPVRARQLMVLFQLVASVLFVLLYIWSTYHPFTFGSLPHVLDLGLAAVFAADYCNRIRASSAPLEFALQPGHLADLLSFIPSLLECVHLALLIPLQPQLALDFRSFRILRALRLLRISLLVGNLPLMRVRRDALLSGGWNVPLLQLVASVVALLVTMASMVHLVEKIPWHNALYFATTTLTTVGYGDIVMHTAMGKLCVGIMMVVGIVIIPVRTSQLYKHLTSRRMRLGPLPRGHWPHLVLSSRLSDVRGFSDFFIEFLAEAHRQGLAPTLRMVVISNRPSFEFRAFQELNEDRLTLFEGSVFSERDMEEVRTAQAEGVAILADRFTQDPAQEDVDVQFRVWAIKSYTKKVPLFVQVLQRSSIARVAPFLDGQRDVLLCVEQVRHRLLALACICPGAATLLGNLLRGSALGSWQWGSTDPAAPWRPPRKLANRRWLRQYVEGCRFELFTCVVGAGMSGRGFHSCVVEMYRHHQVLMIGVLNQQGVLVVNPSGSLRLHVGQSVLVLAPCQEAADAAVSLDLVRKDKTGHQANEDGEGGWWTSLAQALGRGPTALSGEPDQQLSLSSRPAQPSPEQRQQSSTVPRGPSGHGTLGTTATGVTTAVDHDLSATGGSDEASHPLTLNAKDLSGTSSGQRSVSTYDGECEMLWEAVEGVVLEADSLDEVKMEKLQACWKKIPKTREGQVEGPSILKLEDTIDDVIQPREQSHVYGRSLWDGDMTSSRKEDVRWHADDSDPSRLEGGSSIAPGESKLSSPFPAPGWLSSTLSSGERSGSADDGECELLWDAVDGVILETDSLDEVKMERLAACWKKRRNRPPLARDEGKEGQHFVPPLSSSWCSPQVDMPQASSPGTPQPPASTGTTTLTSLDAVPGVPIQSQRGPLGQGTHSPRPVHTDSEVLPASLWQHNTPLSPTSSSGPLSGHVVISGSQDSFVTFVSQLRQCVPDPPITILVLHPHYPKRIMEQLSRMGPTCYVQGLPSDRDSLKTAGAATASALVHLGPPQRPGPTSSKGPSQDEGDYGHTTRAAVLTDAEALLTCFGAGEDGSLPDMTAVIVELGFTSSVRFLQPGLLLQANKPRGLGWDLSRSGSPESPQATQELRGPRRSWLSRKRQEAACQEKGLLEWQANPYYCAGRVLVPAVMDIITCQAFFKRRLLLDLMTELAGDDGRPGGALLRSIHLPDEFVGRPYGELVSHLVLYEGIIPLGLYRRKSENPLWRMGFVSTNPNSKEVLESTDHVIVLRQNDGQAHNAR